ncbi:MAG: FemAB family XrtA/PEP-CTERM system-associated protein [Pseudomonadota bacterium]
MTVKVDILQADEISKVAAFVRENPEASFFHLPEWKSVIERAFGHRVPYLVARRGGAVEGVMPLVHVKSRLFGNALISNAFCVRGGAVAASEEARKALDAKALQVLDEVQAEYLEVRSPVVRHSEDEGWLAREDLYFNFSRAIEPSEEACLKQIPRKQRAVVRKALTDPTLTTTLDTTVDDFFRLYAFSVRNHGTPVFAKKYVRLLREAFGPACEVLTIRKDGAPVASVLSFLFRDTVLPYYTGGTFEARKLGANDLMYWHVMRRAADQGLTQFDFGRSKAGTGPFSFKKNWGFTPEPIVHEFLMAGGADLPNLNPTNPKYALFIKAWKRLPLPLANAVGPHIVRNIG